MESRPPVRMTLTGIPKVSTQEVFVQNSTAHQHKFCTGVSPSGTGLSALPKIPAEGRAFTLPGFDP
jgi:hypothetical protein